jgi:hypothetical protein
LNTTGWLLSKHSGSVIKTSILMLYRELIAVCSDVHTKQIYAICRQNEEAVYVEPGGM